MVKVSIIVPVYNVEQYIESCLKSVICQTYRGEIECILVDDCTPDRSMDIVRQIVSDCSAEIEFKMIRHEYNRGLSAARNTGVQAATGQYLYFLDSDDELPDNSIELLVDRLLQYGEVDFVIGGIRVVGTKMYYPLLIDEYVDTHTQIMSSYFTNKWCVMAWNKLINKDFFIARHLWFTEGIIYEDLLFSFQLAIQAHTMASVREDTYIYKVRSTDSLTSAVSLKKLQDMLKIIETNYEYIRKEVPVSTRLPVYFYIVKRAYAFLEYLMRSDTVEESVKVELQTRLSDQFKQMQQYRSFQGIKILVQSLILRFPWNLQKKIFCIHHLVLFLKSRF